MQASRWQRLVGLGGVALALVACGSGDAGDAEADCAPWEELLEQGGIHVLPGVEVDYEYSPPTSGPHQLPGPAAGVADEPVPEPLQVSALESGMVLVQYGPDVSPTDRAALRSLTTTDDQVLVAPAVRTIDDGAEVALTAWGVRQLCTEVDIEVAEAFIDRWAGVVFANHDP